METYVLSLSTLAYKSSKLSICLSVFVSFSLCLSVFWFVCVSVPVCVCLFLCLSVCLFVCRSVRLSVLPVYLYVCLFELHL